MAYTLSTLAYVKVLLHAAKYPSSTVVGIFTGEKGTNQISNVIPLLHHWAELSPMMEAGLQLAEQHLLSFTPAHVFLGIYIVNSRLEDTSIPPALKVVADSMRRENENTLIIIVDNLKLATNESALLPFSSPSASPISWTPLSPASFSLQDDRAPSIAIRQIKSDQQMNLFDFDDHLENTSRDWLVNDKIKL